MKFMDDGRKKKVGEKYETWHFVAVGEREEHEQTCTGEETKVRYMHVIKVHLISHAHVNYFI